MYGQNDYQVYLVGHSMGGLVARAYLESLGNPVGGTADKWYGKIKALITLGTPHLGAPLAVEAITGALGRILAAIKLIMPLINIPPNYGAMIQAFVNSQYCPSAYELLPPPSSVSPATNRTQFIKTLLASSYNIFDLSPSGDGKNILQWLVSKGLNQSNLANAKDFLTSLNYTGSVQPSQAALPAYYCVYGSGFNAGGVPVTCNSLLWTVLPTPGLTYIGGDGDLIVPTWSAQFSGRTVAGSYDAAGVNHLQMPGDQSVLQEVAQWMGLGSKMAELRSAYEAEHVSGQKSEVGELTMV
jgi:pimeloyl-ACP methyl ester carboxylesterase